MSESRITLSELQKLITQTFDAELNNHFWVSAEISELKINYSGHCYLELIEKDKDSICARLRAVIWSRQARFLLSFFKTTTGTELAEGISVLIKGKLDYHPIYGISFTIVDIDPRFTIGDLAQKRNEILKKLESDGVIDMNKELKLALHPERVAVISSDDAAGFGDFNDQLLNNKFDYHYKIDLFPAVMQGVATEKSVIKALNKIGESVSSYDIVVIVRGGGSQADLSWFDNYEIAYLITQFPIPVISGIGHDKDSSVTDMVSHTTCKTPTAVADLIIEISADTERYIISIMREISKSSKRTIALSQSKIESIERLLISSSNSRISGNNLRLNTARELIASGAKRFIQGKYTFLDNLSLKLKSEPGKTIENYKKRISNIERSVDHLSPDNVLKRGYSITLLKGKSINNSGEIKKGDRLTTILYKGNIESDVFDIKE